MAFDPLSWAIGFTLSRTAGRLLKTSEAKAFANSLRDAVVDWSHGLPKEWSDLHPDAIVNRLFEAPSEVLGPKRRQLQECFEEETPPSEDVWFEAICERRREVYEEIGDDAQTFFKADRPVVEPHIRELAHALHLTCIKNETFFKVDIHRMLTELLERDRRRERPLPRRTPPADGLGVLHSVPALPQKFVARPEYSGPLKEKLLAGKGKAVAVTAAGKRKVGVQGMGGIGKTVLAAAAVQEEEVRRAFPDGVFWLTFGQQPNLIARQVQLARSLGDERPAFEDTQQGRARLEELLRETTCLIVLDDIWDAQHVQPFDVLGKSSRLLVTTRFRNIVASIGAQEQSLDVLEEKQAFVLLAQWAGTTVDELPILSAHEVVKECGGLPLALAMIGAMIRRRPEGWEDAVERLRNADIDKIRRDFPDYPFPDLLRAIEVSIDGLDEVKDRYLDFALFPEDTPIPEAVLQTLWQADGLDKHDVRDNLVLLEDRSMLRRDEKGRITLHDLQFDYVRKQARESLATRHGKLLDVYQAQCEDGWHTVPDDGYFYQHSAYHFYQAGRQDELRELLFDYRLLRKNVEITDPNEIVADYGFLPDDPDLQLLQSAIRLSIPALAKDPSHLPSQLCGRLLSEKAQPVQSLLNQAVKWQSGPWLRPLAASLTRPGETLVLTLKGHTQRVSAVAVSPDTRYAVSGSEDRTLIVWDLNTGKNLRQLTGHENTVTAVAVTPDGRYAVSGSRDQSLIVWDLNTGKNLRQLTGHKSRVVAAAVTPDGRYAVSASENKELKVWDLQSGSVVHTLSGHKDFVGAVAVTPDGRYAISGSFDKTLKVWDLQSGSLVRTLSGHEGFVLAVAVTPDGRYAVSGSYKRSLMVWDLGTGKKLQHLTGHKGPVEAVAVTGDGRYAVSASEDMSLIVWDLKTGKKRRELKGHAGTVNAVAVTADGHNVVSASDDQTLRVWDLDTSKKRRQVRDHAGPVSALVVTRNGRYAVSGSADKTLIVWDLATGKNLRQLKGHTDRVRAVAVTADSRYAVSGSADKTLMVWDLASGKRRRRLKGRVSSVCAVALTCDGRYVVSAFENGTVMVWDLSTGRHLRQLTGHKNWVAWAVGVTPDGRYAVSGSKDQTLKVWDLQSGALVHTLAGHEASVRAVAVTADGRYAVSASGDRTLKVWDLASGSVVHTLAGHEDGVGAVAVTGDGRYAVSASHDKTLKVWDLASGSVVHTLSGHEGGVGAVAVTGDGRYAVSASSDRTLKVWDLATGKAVAGFCGDARIISCAVASDGRTIVGGDALGRVHFLRLENVD